MKLFGFEIRRVRNLPPVEIADDEVMERMMTMDDEELAVVHELLARSVEDARAEAEDPDVVSNPQRLAYVCGGAAFLQSARARLLETRQVALHRATHGPEVTVSPGR
jgi:ferredoxin-NADP reductase